MEETKRTKLDEQAQWSTAASIKFGDAPSWAFTPTAVTSSKPVSSIATSGGLGGAKTDEDVPAWLKGASEKGKLASFGAASYFGSTASFGSSSIFGGGTPLATFGSTFPTFGASGESVFGSSDKRKKQKEDDDDDESSKDGEGDSDNDNDNSQAPAEFGGVDEKEEHIPATDLATGEEDEFHIFQGRVKLYKLVKKDDKSSWTELGSGQIRVNIPADSAENESAKESTGRKRPRVIMRREGVYKLLLNAVIQPDMAVEPVTEKMLRFVCESFTEDNPDRQFASFLVKCSREEERNALNKAICDAIELRKAENEKRSKQTEAVSQETRKDVISPADKSGSV